MVLYHTGAFCPIMAVLPHIRSFCPKWVWAFCPNDGAKRPHFQYITFISMTTALMSNNFDLNVKYMFRYHYQ